MIIKKLPLTLIVLALALILGGYSAYKEYQKSQIATKKQEEIKQAVNPIFGSISAPKISFVYQSEQNATIGVDVPTEQAPAYTAPVYQYLKDTKVDEKTARQIAQSLKLETTAFPQEDGSSIFYNRDKSASLTFWNEFQQFSFYDQGLNYNLTRPTREGAVLTAKNYLNEFKLDSFNLIPDETGVAYKISKGNQYPTDGTADTYDTVFVPFVRNLGSPAGEFKTTSLPYQSYLLTMMIGPENKIKNLSLYYTALDTSRFGTYPLKDIKGAIEEVKENKGILVNLKMPESFYFDVDAPKPKVVSVSVQQYEIKILDKQNIDYAQPVYVFEGMASLEDGQVVPATYFVPAVDVEW
ncbi:hypothetical protein KJ664_01835 [Patescibacteria group bacterium]|nr:hypothetical protein [Patescibacteria group bacterium]